MKKSTKNLIIIIASIFCTVVLGLTIGLMIKNFSTKEPLNIVLTTVLFAFLIAIVAACGVVLFKLLNRLDGVQKRLDKMAYYDHLTELPNRRFLLEYFQGLSAFDENTPFALFFIDMDNFKLVNDNEGHDIGDEFLKSTANYLQKAVMGDKNAALGSGVSNVVVRFGGDEFILIVTKISSRQDASAYAKQLIDGFASDGIHEYIQKYGVGLSIGVAFYPYHSKDCAKLINLADSSMYKAKKCGKNNYCIYDEIEAKAELL